MFVELFEIVPIGDGSHYLCKDSSGIYFTEHKAFDRREQLAFDLEVTVQKYIEKYLDVDKYKPEIFGHNTDYQIFDVITDHDIETEGVWIINPDGWYPYCSECGYEPKWSKEDNRTPTCPNCGRKMRKEYED